MNQSPLLKILALSILLPLTPIQAEEPLSDTETRSLLKQITMKSILPIYQALDHHAQDLVTTTQTFCRKPDEAGLKRIRKSWSNTLSAWQQSSPLLFGPATEDSIDFTLYFRPVKKAVINGFLAKIAADSTLTIDRKAIEKSGVGGQGLATIEYLLFDRKQSDAVLSSFTDRKTGKQRCEYLVSVEALLAKNARTILQAWAQDGENYSEAFYTGGDGSAYFTKAYQPLELLVNRLYQAIQAVEIKQLGVPLGLRGSHTGKQRTYPYKLEAWRSGHSLQNIMSVLQGLERVLVDGGMLDALKNSQHEVLATKLEQQLKTLLNTKFPSDDLFQLLKDSPAKVTTFYEQIKVFAGTIANDFSSVLGVQMGFNRNDGD